jgi:quercetin dioxygenase-like cupin family protein
MKREVFDMTTLVPIVRNAGEGDKQSFAGGGLHLWKLLAEETGGAFFLFEDTMLRDKTTPLHLHPEAHELTYVIDGEIEVEVDGLRTRVRSGGVSFVPKGVAHAFIVVSAEARLIDIQTPGAVGQSFYRGASDPATDDDADTLDLARLQATAADNPRAITILGPPPFAGASTR